MYVLHCNDADFGLYRGCSIYVCMYVDILCNAVFGGIIRAEMEMVSSGWRWRIAENIARYCSVFGRARRILSIPIVFINYYYYIVRIILRDMLAYSSANLYAWIY